MNKDEYIIDIKDENITFSFIKNAINNIYKDKSKNEEINNIQNNPDNINNLFFEDIDKLLNSIKIIENIYKHIYKRNLNSYHLFKRNMRYINKLSMTKQNKIFKKLKINKYEIILAIFIIYLKNYIKDKNHDKIKKLLLIIIRLIAENIFPLNFFTIITEIFINILILILNFNSDYKYSLNDEPFILINDIIESIVTYPKEIKIENINNYILTDIIDIFDKYLITPNYLNIDFKETSIWLKFLENHMINPLKEAEININNDNNLIHKENEKNESIQKKIYFFLIKIYKFNMKDEYFQNNIMKKGIINLKYSINCLNYLIHLFNEEDKLQADDSSFKIKSGFKLQKDNFLFLPKIKLKLSEYSIIFSFKINQISKDGEEINILNLYKNKNRYILNISVDKDNYLIIRYNGDRKWNTFIKIQENKFYLICLSQSKPIIGNPKLNLYINESINEDKIKDGENKGIEIQECDSCYYYKHKMNNSLEFSKDIFLELGKNNFIGVIGELLIINECLTKENIHHLFNLKEKYSFVLSKINNKYEILYSNDSLDNPALGINKLKKNEKRSIDYFKQLAYEIKLEIMVYKINRFTKLKYFSQNYYNQELTNNIIKKTDKDYNESNLSLISLLSMKSSNNSPNSSSVFSSSNNLFNYSFNNTTYVYQKDTYKQEKIDINLNIFKLIYSSIVFYQNNGIDFLTLQLHNIISTIEEQKLLDIYLYEIINFMYKLMLIMNDYIIDLSIRKSPKLDNKVSIFFLTLLTLLNKKKEKIFLNNNIILKLLEILDYFKYNQLFHQRNIILNILLDIKFYQNKFDIMKYPKLLKSMTSDLVDDSNNDISIISSELLYKILLLDFIFETKDYKHKSLMKLICAFLTFNKNKQNEKSEMYEIIFNEFINYFLSLKNEITIYHYLKIIYINLNKLKYKLSKNEKFLENINMRMEKINYNHCKYCTYNQILWYLIYEEICIKSSTENDYCFHYNPIGFMKNPSISFIKCIFVQCFSFSNEIKLKFIKSKLEGIQFIISEIKNNNKKNSDPKALDIKLSEIIGFNMFIPRFKEIIAYIKYLFDEQRESNDIILNVIKESINIIMDFLKEIYLERINNIQNYNYNDIQKNWSIINNDNINNIYIESEKHSKENRLIQKYEDFIEELLCSEGIKGFYNLYLSINYKKAIEDIKYFIDISIKHIFNPFYFYFFSVDINFENDINIEYLSGNDEIKDINQYIKFHLFNLLGTELTKDKIFFDDLQYRVIIKNNILLLIYIYQNMINNTIEINEEFEKNIILFLNYLLDNFFINCKYIFDINSILNDNNIKDKPNKKFLIEIIVDILFILYDNKNYDLKYQYLIKGIFKNKKLNLKKIDEKYFLESKNKGATFKLFNENYLQNICKGVEISEIFYTIYFLYYLCEKLNKYKNNNIENKDNSEPIRLINEIMSSIFGEVKKLYSTYYNKMIDLRKNVVNKYPYKIYKNFMSLFLDKYRDNDFTLDKLINHYDRLIVKKDINTERNTYFMNEESFKNSSLSHSLNANNENDFFHNTMKNPFSRSKFQKKVLINNDENSNSNKDNKNNNSFKIFRKKSKSVSISSKKIILIKTNKNKSLKKKNPLLKKNSFEYFYNEENSSTKNININNLNNNNENNENNNIDNENIKIINIDFEKEKTDKNYSLTEKKENIDINKNKIMNL